MAEYPALPLFTDAYLGDTTHLTTLEHGAYMLLLMAAWRSTTADLPDDDKMLARYTKMTMANWLKIRPIMLGFHEIKNGRWCQRRLKDERRRLYNLKAVNSAAGRSSALKRKERHSTTVANPLQRNANEPPTPTPTPTLDISNDISPPISPKLSTALAQTDLPPCIPLPAWANWLAYRKQIRKPIAAATAKQQINKLAHWHAAGHDPTKIINTSIERGWTGLFEPQKNEAKNGKQHIENTRTKSENAAAQAVAELVRDGCFIHGRDDSTDF